MSMREISYGRAGMEALVEEMRRDPTTLHLATDAPPSLVEEFGEQRIRATPIAENAFSGIAIGAAGSGLRPIVNWSMVTFCFVAMDQIVNQASKIHYMFGGQQTFPLVFRSSVGGGTSLAAQHSQSPYSMFMNLAGLKLILPSTPYDMKGLLKSAIRDDNPVLVFENKMMYNDVGPVPETEFVVPLGQADIKRTGQDITLVATSSMVKLSLQAAESLAEEGVEAEVVDVRSLYPLDADTLVESVKKTGYAVIIDEGAARYGVTGELASLIQERAFDWLDGPVLRIAGADVPIPFSPALELPTIPDVERIIAAVHSLRG